MAIGQGALTGQTAQPRSWVASVRFPARVAARSIWAVGRLLTGAGSGYRSYPRERFSDYELHQLVAGRKDRLDGLP